ncbi:MAG: hypothetical protein PHH44_04300 [bacterium]|nr:hypothetical protein [bacterium]
MRNLFFSIIILSCLFPVLALAEEEPAGAQTQLFLQQRAEIQILNLVNSLYLTTPQVQLIFERAKMARIMSRLYDIRSEELLQALNPLLLKLKETLAAGQDVPAELKEAVNKAKQEFETVKENYEKHRLKLAADVKDCLDGGQLYIINTYQPCLVPPPGPGRIGQAEKNEGAEKMLANVRALPLAKYERRRNDLAGKMIRQIRKKLPVGFVIDEAKETARIIAFFDEARKMDEVSFNVHKEELVAAFKSAYVVPQLPLDITVKIDKFLLDEKIISLLKQRL